MSYPIIPTRLCVIGADTPCVFPATRTNTIKVIIGRFSIKSGACFPNRIVITATIAWMMNLYSCPFHDKGSCNYPLSIRKLNRFGVKGRRNNYSAHFINKKSVNFHSQVPSSSSSTWFLRERWHIISGYQSDTGRRPLKIVIRTQPRCRLPRWRTLN